MAFFVPGPPPRKPGDINVGVTISANMPGLASPQPNREPEQGITTLVNKTDAELYQHLNPETLEPIGVAKQSNLNPELKGPLSATHAKSDPVTGDVFNYNLEIGRQATYRVFHASASTGKTSVLATITGVPGAYLHSLALTENYVILCIWNCHLAMGGLKVLYEKNIVDAVSDFDPSKPTLWYIVDRKHGKGVVARYTSDAFFCFHTVNAFEEPSASGDAAGKTVDIYADLAVYDDLSVIKRFYYENLKSTGPGVHQFAGAKGDNARPTLKRFHLAGIPDAASLERTPSEPKAGEARVVISAAKRESCELPTLNPRFVTRRHRYVYGIADRAKSSFVDGIVKYDFDSRTALFWDRPGHTAGEPIFVADPSGRDEDDGVLLSVVLDGNKGTSYLLCLDARTMKEVARAEMDWAVGFGFHGTFVGRKDKWGYQH